MSNDSLCVCVCIVYCILYISILYLGFEIGLFEKVTYVLDTYTCRIIICILKEVMAELLLCSMLFIVNVFLLTGALDVAFLLFLKLIFTMKYALLNI